MEAWPIKALKAAPISRKLEIDQNAKSCSKQKKLLETRKVAKKLPSNLWQALVTSWLRDMKFFLGDRAQVAPNRGEAQDNFHHANCTV